MSFGKKKGQINFNSEAKEIPQEKIALQYQISPQPAGSTELEKWLTERYCLSTKPSHQLLRLDIAHNPWKRKYVQGEISINTMALYLGKNFKYEKPVAHYAEMKKMCFFHL